MCYRRSLVEIGEGYYLMTIVGRFGGLKTREIDINKCIEGEHNSTHSAHYTLTMHNYNFKNNTL